MTKAVGLKIDLPAKEQFGQIGELRALDIPSHSLLGCPKYS